MVELPLVHFASHDALLPALQSSSFPLVAVLETVAVNEVVIYT